MDIVKEWNGGTIYIYKDVFDRGIVEAGNVFFHESTHIETDANDADKKFRNYLSKLLGAVAEKIYPFQESVDDNGVAQGITLNELETVLEETKKVKTKKSPKVTKGKTQSNGKIGTRPKGGNDRDD